MIKLEPLIGRDRQGNDVRSAVDKIVVEEMGTRTVAGYVHRRPGSRIQLIVTGLSQAQVEEMKRLANERDCEGTNEEAANMIRNTPREVQYANGITDEPT